MKDLELNTDRAQRFKKVDARVELKRVTNDISAQFFVNFTATLVCVRCLEKFEKNFEGKLHLDYIEGRDPFIKNERVELKPTDADKVFYCGNEIDLSIGIREAIILSLPIAPLCEDNCPGLCPICGKNLKLDRCNCRTEKIGLFTPKNR